jgi:hypothetical protein
VAVAPVVEETTQAQSPATRALTLAGMSCLVLLALPWLSRLGNIDGYDVPSLLGLAGAVAAAVLALGAFRADPIRALTALALSAFPILVLGMYFLTVLGGGLQIGN